MSLDDAIWLGNIVIEAALVLLLAYRRIWRTMPVFCAYCAWSVFCDIGLNCIHHFLPARYLSAYLVSLAVDSTLETCVLIELTWSVLRPFHSSLPRGSLAGVSLTILALGAAIWPFSGIHGLATLPLGFRFLVHLAQSTSMLRVLYFLALAGCSRLLVIGWRDRELQVATGLGFYSLVSVLVEVIHSHMEWGKNYTALNRFVVASYTCSLIYWLFSFSQKEVVRQEFSPQMMRALTALAGTAHSTRLQLDGSVPNARPEDEKP